MKSTDAEERRTSVGVLVVRVYALEGLDRATKEAVGILWVAMLPVVPYFINHLSSRTPTLAPFSLK
jgi:hypothetical protein